MNGLIGKKVGMTSIFDDKGNSVGVTVIELGPNTVTQVKTKDGADKYDAVQLSFGTAKEKNTSQAMMGHFKKAGVTGAHKEVAEFRDATITAPLGAVINVSDIFKEGDMVQITGTSKGKGFQGVVKRHGFSGVGEATRGQHNRARAPGSIGASSFPSKVFKGMRMAGRMGNDKVTVKGLLIMKIMQEQNVILIKGAVAGHTNSYVIVEKK